MTRFFDVLRRVRAVEDLDPRDEVIAFAFDVEVTARPAVISIVHDTAGIGLEAMLGAGHFGNDEVRFAPMAKHVMAQLRGP